ncbi:hypothetical protein [Planctomycetes bacterium Poly30]
MRTPWIQLLVPIPLSIVLCLSGISCSQDNEAREETADSASSSAVLTGEWSLGKPLTSEQITDIVGDKVPRFGDLEPGTLPAKGPLAVRFPNFTEFTFEDVSGWTLSVNKGQEGPKRAPYLQLVATRGSERHVVDDQSAGNNELTIDGKTRSGTGFLLLKSEELRSYSSSNILLELREQLEAPGSSDD